MKFLFISHAQKDAKLIKAFVDMLYNIGVERNSMFCSSVSELGVPIKEDIYDYLRNLLDSDEVIPIFMLSQNYYDSVACLNEMGAVWLKQQEYYSFLLPGFDFKQICGAINPYKRAIKLDNPETEALQDDLTSFKNSLCSVLGLQTISEPRWEHCRKQFIDSINDSCVKDIDFNIEASETFCINDINHGACNRYIDKLCGKLIFDFDFRKTSSKQCSLVLFTGGINLIKEYKLGKKLEFELKASKKIKELFVEMHLLSKNLSTSIHTDDEWQKYTIPLSEFTNLENDWQCCNEICFVVNRSLIKNGVIEIKNIKIV